LFIQQISVFLENTPGRLAELTTQLGQHGIDMLALSIADTKDFGVMRAIGSHTDKAQQVLTDAGFTANVTNVIAVEVPDHPGGLASVLCLLRDQNISVEYMYSFVRHIDHNAVMIMRFANPDDALRVFTQHQIKLLSAEQIMA